MRIAVLGTGGVGAYFGGRLAAAGEEIAFVSRGAKLAALQEHGLEIDSPHGHLKLASVRATDRVDTIGPVDIVLLTVKLYDLDAASEKLPPLIGPQTAVITVQNGVEAASVVSRYVGNKHVVPGAAYIVAHVDRPGHVQHHVAQQLVFGETDGAKSERLMDFQAACTRAGFQAVVSSHIDTDLWVKFIRLATWSGMGSAMRSPMGVIRDQPDALDMMMRGFDEAIAVGRAKGIPLPGNLIDETERLLFNFPADSKSSMLEDLEHGRRLELPWLSGAVVRLGREVGVPTPIHGFITTVLTPFVDGAKSQ